ncbi:MAG: AraC family transcriptional regulator [Opitutales bacterium]|nr:AraC family transcriptional regulator [Opitutales bacterium]
MKPGLEAIPLTHGGPSILAYARIEREFPWNWHYHPEVELTLITRGRGHRLVGDHRAPYRAGDLVLIGPNLPHTWASEGSSASARANAAVVIQFLPTVFPDALRTLPEFAGLADLFARARRGLVFPAATVARVRERILGLPAADPVRAWTLLAETLTLLGASPARPLASEHYHSQRAARIGSRLGRIIERIETEGDEPLDLPAVARVAGLTPTSFARFFRRMTGRTFVEYRNSCRIRRACRLLAETDRAVLDIALACGFRNLSNFNRAFQKVTNTNPRGYRRRHEGRDGAKERIG